MYYWFGDKQQKLKNRKKDHRPLAEEYQQPITERKYSKKEKDEFLKRFHSIQKKNKRRSIYVIASLIILGLIMMIIMFI